MATDVTVTATGPVFDGTLEALITGACREIETRLGDEAVTAVQDFLDGVLQNPTGYYRSHIAAHVFDDRVEVNDGMVIYGPWLEGVGSRNAPVTRFEGYHTFRAVTPQINALASTVAGEVLTTVLAGAMS